MLNQLQIQEDMKIPKFLQHENLRRKPQYP